MLLCRYTIYHVSRPSQRRLLDPIFASYGSIKGRPAASRRSFRPVYEPEEGDYCPSARKWPPKYVLHLAVTPARYARLTLQEVAPRTPRGSSGRTGGLDVIIIFHAECHYRRRLGGSPGLMWPGDKSRSNQFIGETEESKFWWRPPVLTAALQFYPKHIPGHSQIHKKGNLNHDEPNSSNRLPIGQPKENSTKTVISTLRNLSKNIREKNNVLIFN